MVDVTTKIIINRPIDEVSRYASDPDNAVKWYKNIKSVVWKTAKPLRIGSHIAFQAQFLGRTLEYVYEVLALSPTQLVMRTAYGPFSMETVYMWEKVGKDRTRMVLTNKGNPKGFSVLLTPLMSLAMKKANTDDLKKLKRVLEAKDIQR